MSHLLSNTEPIALWDHFYRLSAIPHPSGGERALCFHVLALAKQLGLDASMDEAGGDGFGNVLVQCPATPGWEKAPVVVLQSHLDMVALPAEKRGRPLALFLDGSMLRARGTTLGADNGIAVAMALTLMTDREIAHGPLELLFTVNEEAGMTGVRALSDRLLKGRFLLNIDSQQQEVLTVGCAGVNRSLLKLPLAMGTVDRGLAAVRIGVTGGKGGHSGLEINSGRANAGRELARILYEESKVRFLQLAEVSWGTVDNAIPAEAWAVVLIQPGDWNALQEALSRWERVLQEEFGSAEGRLAVEAARQETLPEAALGRDPTTQLLSFLLVLPHGVQTMSREVEGLVETSANVAVVRTGPDELTVNVSQRSMNDASLDAVMTRCEAVGRLGGAQVAHQGKTYGWKPNMASPLLGLAQEAYRQVYGEAPKVQGLHGMLECALIKGKYPHIDMISCGPTIWDAHAPTPEDFVCGVDSAATGERIDTARMPRFWEFLKTLLGRLAKSDG